MKANLAESHGVRHLYPLTSLRAVAAFLIVLFHLSGVGLTPFKPTPMLANGVSFFFVLSGFILTYNYRTIEGFGSFYFKRIARLYPVYLGLLLLALFLRPALVVFVTKGNGAEIFWAHLFMLQAWVPVKAFPINFNGVAWSISVEMFFYALFPVFVVARKWFWAILFLIFSATIGALVITDFILNIPTSSDPWTFSPKEFAVHFPPMRLLEFAAGVATARLFLSERFRLILPTLMEVLAVALVIGVVFASDHMRILLSRQQHIAISEWIGQSGSFLAFCIAFFVFAHSKGMLSRVLSWRPLVLLGEISFATYMFHHMVIGHAVRTEMPRILGDGMTITLILIISYAGSYVIWKGIEIPARAGLMSGWYGLKNLLGKSHQKSGSSVQ